MNAPVQPETRWGDFGLAAARLAWMAAFLLAAGLWIMGSVETAGRPPPSCVENACDPFALSAEDLEMMVSLGLPADMISAFWSLTNMGFAIVFFLIALVIFWRAPNTWVGLVISFTLVYLGAVFFTESDDALWRARPDLRWLLAMVYALGYSALMCLFFYFPDGKFAPRAKHLGMIAVPLILLIAPFTVNATRGEQPAAGLFVGSVAVGVAAQIHRYRRLSNRLQRQQTKWVLFGLMSALLVMLIWLFTGANLPPDQPRPERIYFLLFTRALIIILIPLLPLSIAFSILRYRLFDIDVIINRVLVYGTLTAVVTALYVFIVGGLGLFLHSTGNLVLALLATGLAAALFQPARQRLQAAVNRLMYGERDDPAALLARLGEHLERTGSPQAALIGIVESVAQALKLPYAAIELGERAEMAASYGLPVDETQPFPLIHQGETVGQMRVAPRSSGESLTAKDQRLLETIARQAGAVAYAARLTADLRRSRQRLVIAREEERRRIRRDLHDGLGPVLASQGLKMAAASQLIEEDPAKARRFLDELAAQNEAAVGEIRRLVYDLRPPALDDLGLAGAIRDYATGLQVGAGSPEIDVQAPAAGLPPLPAAIEVAAYRIAAEALTNIARHAQARHGTVAFRLESTGRGKTLRLEITDDGVGLSPESKAGVGLISMRERAEEIGGSLHIESAPGRGCRVLAALPLDEEA